MHVVVHVMGRREAAYSQIYGSGKAVGSFQATSHDVNSLIRSGGLLRMKVRVWPDILWVEVGILLSYRRIIVGGTVGNVILL
jgi:hypothetical protein